MLNAFVSWYQEKQAGDIVKQLKAGIAMKAIVPSRKRYEHWKELYKIKNYYKPSERYKCHII